MPGIIGHIGHPNRERIGAAANKIRHVPDLEAWFFEPVPEVVLAQVSKTRWQRSDDWCDDHSCGVAVLIHGAVFAATPQPRRLNAETIVADFLRDGTDCVDAYDGSFVIVIVDRRGGVVHVINDRLGSQSVYWIERDGELWFGPETKAVLAASATPRAFSQAGIINFLTVGYNLADETLFEGVSCLFPGSVLSCPLAGSGSRQTRYWKLRFAPRQELRSRPEAEQALHDAILDGHRLYLSDEPQDYQLLLSGGMDSRCILGALGELSALPSSALNWGLRQDIPYSDASIATRLAEMFNVPLSFFAYDTDALLENASDWAYVTELVTDNIGWYAEGTPALRTFYDRSANFSFTGDEAWGWVGYATNELESRAATFPPRLPDLLRGCMRAEAIPAAGERYDHTLNKITDACENDDWTDRKDFLYLHGRVSRFNCSLAYYREFATQHRRPFLTKGVLDVVSGLPAEFRVHKNLFISMLRRFYPDIMQVPPNFVSSLPDWMHDLRTKPGLRELFLGLLDPRTIEQTALAEFLDPHAVATLATEFFSAPSTPLERDVSATARFVNRIRGQLQVKPWYRALAEPAKKLRRGGGEPPDRVKPIDILRRISLLVLLEQQKGRLGTS
jgi:hypothetical protein